MTYRLVLIIMFVLVSVMSISAQEDDILFPDLDVLSTDNIARLEQIATIDSGTGYIRGLQWSPTDMRLAVIREADIKISVEIWDFENATLPTAPTVTFYPLAVDELHWLPDGQSLVTHGTHYEDTTVFYDVVRWDSDNGEQLEVLLSAVIEREILYEFDGYTRYSHVNPPIIGWNTDYKDFATSQGNLAFHIVNGSTFTTESEYGWIQSLFWSPDNASIAMIHKSSDDTYNMVLLNASTLETVDSSFGEDYVVSDLAWSPDSSTFAVASFWLNPYTPLINVRFYGYEENAFFSPRESFVRVSVEIPEGANYRFADMAWSPDSDIIAISVPDTLYLLEPVSNNLVTFPEVGITAVDWHVSGQIIATGTQGGTIHLWGVPINSE